MDSGVEVEAAELLVLILGNCVKLFHHIVTSNLIRGASVGRAVRGLERKQPARTNDARNRHQSTRLLRKGAGGVYPGEGKYIEDGSAPPSKFPISTSSLPGSTARPPYSRSRRQRTTVSTQNTKIVTNTQHTIPPRGKKQRWRWALYSPLKSLFRCCGVFLRSDFVGSPFLDFRPRDAWFSSAFILYFLFNQMMFMA